ncbi:hypothetical protein FOCC_FOCC006749 [Frankliniella occidentalis]|nr:hypothetical protein FOCC_FOCC006749 [Frankliniella occidentalis]
MYSRPCHSTVSHSTWLLSVNWSTNVKRSDSSDLAAFNNSFSCNHRIKLRSALTESSFGFPTPLPSVLSDGDTIVKAVWGPSGPRLRPCAQRYTVLGHGLHLGRAENRTKVIHNNLSETNPLAASRKLKLWQGFVTFTGTYIITCYAVGSGSTGLFIDWTQATLSPNSLQKQWSHNTRAFVAY